MTSRQVNVLLFLRRGTTPWQLAGILRSSSPPRQVTNRSPLSMWWSSQSVNPSPSRGEMRSHASLGSGGFLYPLCHSVGSDDDDGEATGWSGRPVVHPPPPAEDTPTPTGPPPPLLGANPAESLAAWDSDGGGVTPPTPIAVTVTPADSTEPIPAVEPLPPAPTGGVAASAPPPQDSDEGNISIEIEKVPTIKEWETEVDFPFQATSPPVLVPPQAEASPQITTMTEVHACLESLVLRVTSCLYFQADLEARIKTEQRGMEGIDGILSSLNEQDQPQGELAVEKLCPKVERTFRVKDTSQ